jgi:hypothetical protein
MPAAKTRTPVFRSDSVRTLLQLLENGSALSPLIGHIFEVLIVLDASYVQRELRWRLGSRRDRAARSDLHEAIESGVLVAVAPTFLKQEIEDHLMEIARDTEVSVEDARAEWKSFELLLRFYEPLTDGCARYVSVDPDDTAYLLTFDQLRANFIGTADRHFSRAEAPVMAPSLDRVLRNYARATSVLVTVRVGSGFAILGGVEILSALFNAAASTIRALPLAVKIVLAVGLAVLLLHPQARRGLVLFLGESWRRLQRSSPVLLSLAKGALEAIADSANLERETTRTIEAELHPGSRRPVLARARVVCMRACEPLSLDEIAQRILNSGYVSRAKNFKAYVRRLLRKDSGFVETVPGRWALGSCSTVA